MVILLRGLNTEGVDQIRLGRWNLGDYYTHWEKELRKREIPFLKLEGLGVGTLSSSYSRLLSILRQWTETAGALPFHVLTHSSGGLLGRKLTYEPEFSGRLRSLTTVACPHQGSHLVLLAERWVKRPAVRGPLKLLGYNLDQRLDHLRELAPETLAQFNKFYPPLRSTPFLNIPCSLPPGQRALLVRALEPCLQERGRSDGVLSVQEQHLEGAKTWGPCRLDHLSSLGHFFHLQGKNRALAQRELRQLFDHVASLWHTLGENS